MNKVLYFMLGAAIVEIYRLRKIEKALKSYLLETEEPNMIYKEYRW